MPTLKDVKEDSTYLITGNVVDENGATIAAASLNSFRMWLFDHEGDIINSRVNVDKSASVSATGALSLVLTPADNPIVTVGNKTERHLLVLEWEWDSSADKAHENIYLIVNNDAEVPTATST